MRRAWFGCLVVGLLTLCGGGSIGQEKAKKDDKDTTGKTLKGQLPQNWSKLGLTDEQKQKVYAAQGKYKEKIDKLQAEINELKDKARKEQLEVLTDAQKKRLEEINKEKSGTADDKKDKKDKEKDK